MSLPRNPNYQRPCYHCRKNEPNRHSVFCDACLAGNDRPLMFPAPERQQAPPLTRLLTLGAIAATVWLIFKTAEVMTQP